MSEGAQAREQVQGEWCSSLLSKRLRFCAAERGNLQATVGHGMSLCPCTAVTAVPHVARKAMRTNCMVRGHRVQLTVLV